LSSPVWITSYGVAHLQYSNTFCPPSEKPTSIAIPMPDGGENGVRRPPTASSAQCVPPQGGVFPCRLFPPALRGQTAGVVNPSHSAGHPPSAFVSRVVRSPQSPTTLAPSPASVVVLTVPVIHNHLSWLQAGVRADGLPCLVAGSPSSRRVVGLAGRRRAANLSRVRDAFRRIIAAFGAKGRGERSAANVWL
jgi:hypothetical protein